MLYYLPYFYHPPNAPHAPTHQLVYVPPTPSSSLHCDALAPARPDPKTRLVVETTFPQSFTPTPSPIPSSSAPRLHPIHSPRSLLMQPNSAATPSQPSPTASHSISATRRNPTAVDHDCVLRRYELTMRQQPVQARMCGVGEKCRSLAPARPHMTDGVADRRPVDPTPIVQLKVIDNNGDDAMSGDHANPSKPRLRRPDPGPSGMTFMQSESTSKRKICL